MIRPFSISRLLSAGAAAALLACSGPADPQLVDRIILTPDSAFATPGAGVSFSAVPISERGDRLEDRASRITWDAPGGPLAGDQSAGATFTATATAIGTGRVFASLGDARATGTVYVEPAGLDRIEIRLEGEAIGPAHTFRVPRDELGPSVNFSAHLFDADGNELSSDGFRVSWASQLGHIVVLQGGDQTPTPRVSLGLAGSADFTLVVGRFRTTTRITVIRTVGE